MGLKQTLFFICVLLALTLTIKVQAAEETPKESSLHSGVDEQLTIQKISVLPFLDNVQGIYSRPLEAHFNDTLNKMHRWDLVPAGNIGPILAPEELEAELEKAQQVSRGISADAYFAAKITKGPNGMTIHLSLFLTSDSKLLAQAILKDFKRFDIEELKEQLGILLEKINNQLPYSGRVLSREANRVTVNLGSRDGVQKDQMLSVIQIIRVTRHPKFHFLISTEKEIIGKIRVLKVDETLSFGVITTERERGVIQKNAKIGMLDFVTYSNADTLDIGASTEDQLRTREDNAIAFGDKAREWVPKRPPSFGQVGGGLGLTSFVGNTKLNTAGSISATNKFAPSFFLAGELWVTSEWTVHAKMRQGIIPVDNPLSGSSPSKLSQSLTSYEMLFGYTFRFGPNVWSPQVEPQLGYMSYRLYVDDSSPRAFTTTEYTGFKVGVRGQFPLTPDDKWGGGAELYMILRSNLKETPATSGASSDNTINQFGLFGVRKLGEHLKAQINLEFEQYSTSFSGTGTRSDSASSSSQRLTSLTGSLYYMF